MTASREQITLPVHAEKIIVICGRVDDAVAWRDLFGAQRCHAIALDAAPPAYHPERPAGATGHLAWQHDMIAKLDTGGWLAQQVQAFDPQLTALLVIPDPLDPPDAGSRPRLGKRHPYTRLLEDKTIVDTVWDQLRLSRVQSIVADTDRDPATLGSLVDSGDGVVCSIRSADGPTSGGDGIRWWTSSRPPPRRIPASPPVRVRLMPLLKGLPVRLHGLAFGSAVIGFPPMEIVSLPRPDYGTFLPAGVVPIQLPRQDELAACTERIGTELQSTLGYRGAFAVDGVLTESGFVPTDFNARLTSAMEPAPPEQRVQLHAVNLLARDGVNLDAGAVEELAKTIFSPGHSLTLYGAAGRIRGNKGAGVGVRWHGNRLVAAKAGPAHGRITVSPSRRGWLVTAVLYADPLPAVGPLSVLAPQVFRLSDELLGTDFGQLLTPFGVGAPPYGSRQPVLTRGARAPLGAAGASAPGPAPQVTQTAAAPPSGQ